MQRSIPVYEPPVTFTPGTAEVLRVQRRSARQSRAVQVAVPAVLMLALCVIAVSLLHDLVGSLLRVVSGGLGA